MKVKITDLGHKYELNPDQLVSFAATTPEKYGLIDFVDVDTALVSSKLAFNLVDDFKCANSNGHDWREFVKEDLYEEDTISAQVPASDPVIAQKLANGQAALNREDLKLQQLKDKMIPINKKKAQIQKAMIKAQEENAAKMSQQAKEQSKQQSQIKASQDAQEAAQQANPVQTPALPTMESILQSDFDKMELLEDQIVVLMQAENPDYDKINELMEAVQAYWTCPSCGREIKIEDEDKANEICRACEDREAEEASLYESDDGPPEEPFEEGTEVYYSKPSYGVHKVLLYDEDKGEYLLELPADDNFPRYEFWTPYWRVLPILESLIVPENFYDLSEAYTEFEDPEKKNEIEDDYLFYIKVYDNDDWFIAKVFKINPDEDWYGLIKAGEDDTFEKISYDPEFDEDAIIEFLMDTYDKVEIIDQEEYNDYVEEKDDSEIDEEGGVSGMHL